MNNFINQISSALDFIKECKFRKKKIQQTIYYNLFKLNCREMNCSLCAKPINDKTYWNHFATHTKNLQEYKQIFLSGETNLAEIAIKSWAMETINASNIIQENI